MHLWLLIRLSLGTLTKVNNSISKASTQDTSREQSSPTPLTIEQKWLPPETTSLAILLATPISRTKLTNSPLKSLPTTPFWAAHRSRSRMSINHLDSLILKVNKTLWSQLDLIQRVLMATLTRNLKLKTTPSQWCQNLMDKTIIFKMSKFQSLWASTNNHTL